MEGVEGRVEHRGSTSSLSIKEANQTLRIMCNFGPHHVVRGRAMKGATITPSLLSF
jgi:hypothetical protein